jgi:hypothetical protein
MRCRTCPDAAGGSTGDGELLVLDIQVNVEGILD